MCANNKRLNEVFSATMQAVANITVATWGYSIKECGFEYIVNPNMDSVKNCILLTNIR